MKVRTERSRRRGPQRESCVHHAAARRADTSPEVPNDGSGSAACGVECTTPHRVEKRGGASAACSTLPMAGYTIDRVT